MRTDGRTAQTASASGCEKDRLNRQDAQYARSREKTLLAFFPGDAGILAVQLVFSLNFTCFERQSGVYSRHDAGSVPAISAL
jgi:hypothetical protein